MGHTLPQLETILEDDELLVVMKPAGLPTANAPRGAPSVYAVVKQAMPAGAFLGVVSRLDAAVSGVLVLAKTRAAAADLSRQFRERSVEKAYGAVVEGRFPAPLGQWVDWRDRIDRRGQERRSTLHRETSVDVHEADDEEDSAGGRCHVRARVVHRSGEVSLVELEPSTGRRHQLRVQLAGHGCPIVGDRVYGARLPFLAAIRSAIALHARSLRLLHPATRRPLWLTADWPPAWSARFPGLPLRGAGLARDEDGRQAGRVN